MAVLGSGVAQLSLFSALRGCGALCGKMMLTATEPAAKAAGWLALGKDPSPRKAGAVRAGDEVAFGVPGEGTDVGFVGFEERLRSCSWMRWIDAIDCSGSACGDVEPAGLVEG